jgi:DNA-binding MarR family transcriptional regulator
MTASGVKQIKTIEILRAIKNHEPVTGPRLAEMFGKSRQAMYMRLKVLERRGFIERVIPGPDAPLVPAQYRTSQKLKDAEKRLAGKEAG